MTFSPAKNVVQFGLFALDLRTRQLTREGAKIRLAQQPIQVLSLLLEVLEKSSRAKNSGDSSGSLVYSSISIMD
jgi:DNA-binding response OmpR family regulator